MQSLGPLSFTVMQHFIRSVFSQVLQGKSIKHQKIPACHIKFTTHWNSMPYPLNKC